MGVPPPPGLCGPAWRCMERQRIDGVPIVPPWMVGAGLENTPAVRERVFLPAESFTPGRRQGSVPGRDRGTRPNHHRDGGLEDVRSHDGLRSLVEAGADRGGTRMLWWRQRLGRSGGSRGAEARRRGAAQEPERKARGAVQRRARWGPGETGAAVGRIGIDPGGSGLTPVPWRDASPEGTRCTGRRVATKITSGEVRMGVTCQ